MIFEDVNKIFEHYKDRKSTDKYSYVAPMSEIEENDYNLNIPRCVDTFEEEKEINLNQVMNDIKSNYIEQEQLNQQINVYLKELGLQEF